MLGFVGLQMFSIGEKTTYFSYEAVLQYVVLHRPTGIDFA